MIYCTEENNPCLQLFLVFLTKKKKNSLHAAQFSQCEFSLILVKLIGLDSLKLDQSVDNGYVLITDSRSLWTNHSQLIVICDKMP